MKHVEACLSAIENRESSYYRFGSTLRLVQAWEIPDNTVLTSEEVL